VHALWGRSVCASCERETALFLLTPFTLLQLFQNLVQWGWLFFWGLLFSRGALASPFVRASSFVIIARTIPMGRFPHLTHVDMPRAVLELADLRDIDPARVFPQLHFVIWAYTDAFSTRLQHDIFS